MSKKTKKSLYVKIKPLVAGLATAGILAICFFVWTWQAKNNQTENFENATTIMKDQVTSKILGYEEVVSNMLRLSGPDGISKSDWDAYFHAIDLNNYKGLSSVSFSKHITRSEKATYERLNYRIFPASNKEEYLPVTYITPSNPSFLGFDTGTSSPERFAWIDKARNSGELQRSNTYAFKPSSSAETVSLMFITVPLYRTSKPVTSTEERYANYTGTILGSLRLDQLVPALLAGIGSTNQFNDIEIYDSVGDGANMMHDSTPARRAHSYPFNSTVQVNMANRPIKIVLGADKKNSGDLPSRKWLIIIVPISVVVALIARKRQF